MKKFNLRFTIPKTIGKMIDSEKRVIINWKYLTLKRLFKLIFAFFLLLIIIIISLWIGGVF